MLAGLEEPDSGPDPHGLGHHHRLPAAGRHRPHGTHGLRRGRPRLPGAPSPQGGAAPDRGPARPRHRGRRRPREAARALRRGDGALQASRRLRDRRPGGRRPEGPRILPRGPAAADRGVLGRLADADRPRQAAARAPEPAADGRAHEPPRPPRPQLARGVPGRLPGLGGARLPRPLLPRRHGEAHHRGGAQAPSPTTTATTRSTWWSTPRGWSNLREAHRARARRSRRPRRSSTGSATRPRRPARSRAGSSSSTRSSGSRSRPRARRSASSSPTRPSRAGWCSS